MMIALLSVPFAPAYRALRGAGTDPAAQAVTVSQNPRFPVLPVCFLSRGGSAVIDSNDLGAPRRGVMDCGIRLPAQRRGGERSAGAGGAVSCSWRNSGGAGPGDP